MFNNEFKVDVDLNGKCKRCGESFKLWKPFYNHLAYDHGIYVSKWYKFKATIKKFFN